MSSRDFPFSLEMIGGSLKIWRSNGWFCIRFHFFIKTSFKVDLRAGTVSRKAIFLFSLCRCVSGVQTPSLLTLYLIEGFLS